MATEAHEAPTEVRPPVAPPPKPDSPMIRPLDEFEHEPDVIDDAAAGKKLSTVETVEALDWLLSDADEDDDFVKTMEIDVGPPGREVWMKWAIRPLDSDEIRAIQTSGTNRAQRRRGAEPDMSEQNRRIVIAGTVAPDLRAVGVQKGVADPSIVLKHKFRHKPLLIEQLAAEILALSGADDEAIRDAREVRAAGN